MTGYDKIKKFVSEVHEINCALTDEIIEFIDEVILQEQVGNVPEANVQPLLYEGRGGVMLLEEIKLNKKISIFERIKSAFAYALLAEVPPCGGERDGWSGEFDCTYEHGIDCDTCVCLYYEHGYRKGIDPRTGKDFKKFSRYFI